MKIPIMRGGPASIAPMSLSSGGGCPCHLFEFLISTGIVHVPDENENCFKDWNVLRGQNFVMSLDNNVYDSSHSSSYIIYVVSKIYTKKG